MSDEKNAVRLPPRPPGAPLIRFITLPGDEPKPAAPQPPLAARPAPAVEPVPTAEAVPTAEPVADAEPAEAVAAAEPAPPAAEAESGTGVVAERVPDGVCPHCGAGVTFGVAVPLSDTTCPSCHATFMTPGRIGGFLLLGRIGTGEMGEIFRARDEALHRDVAIKIVLATRAEDPALHERLSQEARAAAKLSHPHVAQVHALGFSKGHPYLVMELVRGEDMDVTLKREGHIDEGVALRVADQVTEGLLALHREGLAHGDIKPANIILDPEGSAKLVDFGLSGMSRRDGNRAILGTPHYIAPESLRGLPDSPQTDIYSLGATLYHLLAGRPPFDGATPADVVRARLVKPPVSIGRYAKQLSADTQRIVMRMLAANPAKRYADCAALLADIREARSKLEAAAEAAARAREEKEAARAAGTAAKPERRWLKAALIVAPACLAAAGLLTLYAMRPDLLSPRGLLRLIRRPVRAIAPAAPAAGPASAHPSPAPPPERSAGEPAEDSGPGAPGLLEFPRLIAPHWTSIVLGDSSRGSTIWHGGTLVVQGEGVDLGRDGDFCRYVQSIAEGDFALSVEFVTVARTHRQAKTGILVRESRDERGPSLFFGTQGDGVLLLQTRRAGQAEKRVRASKDAIALPLYVRLVRRGDTFEAATSGDGMVWEPFAECLFALPAQATVGLAVASGMPGVLATAEFRGLALRAPALPEPAPQVP